MKLYYHKTDGGAEYLTDKFIVCPNGEKEGTFEGAKYIVRTDGDITKDAELTITSNNDLLEACKASMEYFHEITMQTAWIKEIQIKLEQAIQKAERK